MICLIDMNAASRKKRQLSGYLAGASLAFLVVIAAAQTTKSQTMYQPPPDATSLPGAGQLSPEEQRVAALEHKAFGSTYPEHELDDRLEHLEREEFGKSFAGDAQSRLARLESKLGAGAFSSSAPQAVPGAFVPAAANATYPPGTPYMPPPAPSFATAPPPAQAIMNRNGSFPPVPPPLQRRPGQPVFMGDLRPAELTAAAPPPVPAAAAPPMRHPVQLPPASPPPAGDASALTAPVDDQRADESDDRRASEYQTVVASIPYDAKSGDYLNAVDRYQSYYAHWSEFPIRVHIPYMSSAEERAALQRAVDAWHQLIPVMVVPAKQPADIEIAWINKLASGQLGITNLEVFNGHMRSTIYLLHPSAINLSGGSFDAVAKHELGHALGIWGHSPVSGDLMHAGTSASGKPANISPRDTNTLKKIYQAPALPDGFAIPHPVGWSWRQPQHIILNSGSQTSLDQQCPVVKVPIPRHRSEDVCHNRCKNDHDCPQP